MTKTVLYDFYNAYGQYEFYRDSLKDKGINHPIYLAIPNKAFRKIEEIPALDKWVKKHKINLLIVDVNKEEIVQWIQY